MDTAAFLSRVVPANGNYLSITWPNQDKKKGWAIRSYKAADGHKEAVGMANWLVQRKTDVYFALAAFITADATTSAAGRPIHRADRKGANVQCLRVLVVDADVARPGDGKDTSKTFPTREDALAWLDKFTADAKFPRPNLVVNSGYGYHWYWVLRAPVAPDAWEMLARALKSAILDHGWPGDTGSTVDSSRILRPPGTMNYKVPENPVPVVDLPEYEAPDIENDTMIEALAPFIAVQPKGLRKTGTGGGPMGSNVHPISALGPKPDFIKPEDKGADINQAAHVHVEKRKYHYKFIAARCRQAEKTLATGGMGESRDHWKLTNMTLLAHCVDGEDYVHKISSGDPRYKEFETQDVWAETLAEVEAKEIGAPLCSSFNDHRRDICTMCPHWQAINSPITLGQDDDDLPYGYRRTTRGGVPCVEFKDKMDGEWVLVLMGDVRSPVLDENAAGGHQLQFNYILSGTRSIAVRGFDAGEAKAALLVSIERQGISADRHTAPRVGDLVVAWINKLRAQRSVRVEKSRPFGWNFSSDGTRIGLAVANDLYRADGTEQRVPGGDQRIASMYRPVGEIAKWRKAAALFEGGRADLQALIACSFASPLVSLAGDVRGMSLNFWSIESGIGKSSAIKVGQSVWADYKALQSMRDTANHVMRSLSEPRFIIRYWDELRVRPTTQDEFVDLIFTIPQGKERGRIQADTQMREVGEWECLLAFTSNRSMADFLVGRDDATDAGLARLLEIQMEKEKLPFNAAAGQVIKLTETNYGHAGRIFTKHLAMNAAAVQVKLNKLMAAFATHLSMVQEERFLVCAMACILVGAAEATKLGLFKFDIPGIRAVLEKNFLAARESRERQTKRGEDGKGYDIQELIGEYNYVMAEYRLRTKHFASQGNVKVDVTGWPRSNNICVHISEGERIIRLARADFIAWLRDHQYPARSVIQQIVNDLGATEIKRTIGGGTKYSGSSVWCIDIPLKDRLEGLLSMVRPAGDTHLKNPKHAPLDPPGGDPHTQERGGRLAPGQAVRGNQARM